jgi:hypothetical protein
MILPKPFSCLLLLACLMSIVFAQAPSLTASSLESNSTESIASSTETIASSTSIVTNSATTTSMIESTAISSAIPSTTSSITSSTSSTTSSTSNNANALPTMQTPGWNSNGNNDNLNQQSWLRQHNRFVFVIFLGLIFLSILIWYIVRSVKGMRKRLAQENQAQLYMMQQATSPPPPPLQQQQQQQRNDRVIPELTQTPPPAYKTEEHRPAHSQS